MKYIPYEQCNNKKEINLFFYNQVNYNDTWVEIIEPSSSVTERAAHTLIKVKKATDKMENKILEFESGKVVSSEITRSDDQIISMNVRKSNLCSNVLDSSTIS